MKADEEEHVGGQDRQPARQVAAPYAGPLDQVDERTQGEGQEDRRAGPADRRLDLDDDVVEQHGDADRDDDDRHHLDYGTGLYSRCDHRSSVDGVRRARALPCALRMTHRLDSLALLLLLPLRGE